MPHQLRHFFTIPLAFAATALSLVLCCCDQAEDNAQSAPKLQLTPQAKIDDLIAKKLLRVDINFLQYHPPPEEPADLFGSSAESEIGCILELNNYSEDDLVLDGWMFRHHGWIEIVRLSDDKRMGTLVSQPIPSELKPALFRLPSRDSETFFISYTMFEPFHGARGSDNSIRYRSHGEFVIFHEKFPLDRLTFSVDEDGIVRPKLDLKIQEENVPEPQRISE